MVNRARGTALVSPSEATAAESFAKGKVKADVMSRVIVVVVVIIIVVFILDFTVITTIVVPLHCETLDDGTAERERERYYYYDRSLPALSSFWLSC